MLKLWTSHHEHKEDECQIIVTGLIIDKLDQHSLRYYQLSQCWICKLVSLLLKLAEIVTESSIDPGNVTEIQHILLVEVGGE
jgi:hypothetical protein